MKRIYLTDEIATYPKHPDEFCVKLLYSDFEVLCVCVGVCMCVCVYLCIYIVCVLMHPNSEEEHEKTPHSFIV